VLLGPLEQVLPLAQVLLKGAAWGHLLAEGAERPLSVLVPLVGSRANAPEP